MSFELVHLRTRTRLVGNKRIVPDQASFVLRSPSRKSALVSAISNAKFILGSSIGIRVQQTRYIRNLRPFYKSLGSYTAKNTGALAQYIPTIFSTTSHRQLMYTRSRSRQRMAAVDDESAEQEAPNSQEKGTVVTVINGKKKDPTGRRLARLMIQKSLLFGKNMFSRPELVAISMVYLAQGLLGLSRLAVFTYFKDELNLPPATVGILTGLTMIPWVIKPLYGFLSDSVPIWGYKRRSYLVLCGALGATSWLTVAGNPIDSTYIVVFALTMASLSTACADVVADSIVVELSRGQPQSTAGSLQSLCWASASFGSILSAYFSGSLVELYGPRPVFLMTAAFPMLVGLASAVIPEQPSLEPATKSKGLWPALKLQVFSLWDAISQRSILYPAIFVFLWQATPTADTAMLYFETNKLGFSTEFLGRIRLLASIASLIGVGVYNTVLKKVELRKIFLWTAIIGTGLGMTQLMLITGYNEKLGISNEVFALGDSALLTVLGQVSFMPVLVLAARLCPEGVEATLFATLMSLLNGGSFLGSALGSGLTSWPFGVTADNFDNLAPLVALCTFLTLAPLPFLRLLPRSIDETKENE